MGEVGMPRMLCWNDRIRRELEGLRAEINCGEVWEESKNVVMGAGVTAVGTVTP